MGRRQRQSCIFRQQQNERYNLSKMSHVAGEGMDEAQLLWAVGSLQRRLRTVEETRLATAAAFAERQAVADALQARCLSGIWDPARCTLM